VLGVGRQVEVGAVGDPFELAPLGALEGEAVLDVDGPLGVVRQLLRRVLVVAQVVAVLGNLAKVMNLTEYLQK
jgi:hypothetical protein